ncbi:MAG: citrate synthase [Bacteroidales bacterium]|jgi:citrate synthase|nr:citrate synthase [Bacteroidales bacterium]
MKKTIEDFDSLLKDLTATIQKTSHIENELFNEYSVKRGLRNEDHSGVLVGLTKIGNVVGYKRQEQGNTIPLEGELFYRGYNIKEIVAGFQKDERHGFEEAVFLLLSGRLPIKELLGRFSELLASQRTLDPAIKMSILEFKGVDIMNVLARTVMVMYARDIEADVITRENLVVQSIKLISSFPTIICYAYHSMQHYYRNKTLFIRHPRSELSMAENFLYMLKGEGNYTKLDADVLDLTQVLHAEHGGGNNSTFTVRVISSSNTDTYSAITAGIGSLKGPLHGGANLRVNHMFDHLKKIIKNWNNPAEVKNYMLKILKKEAYDRSGKIYGVGHAVYTISDPRSVILKAMAKKLAIEKERLDEFEFLELIEMMGIEAFMDYKGTKAGKVVSANVDFYSGFVYEMIGIPRELYTPLFAMSRIAGWCAHRIEELNFEKKRIIRPAYKNVCERSEYESMDKR